jgi:peptidoglycan/LPS O-acetylase OafA/YrhL
MQSSAGHYNSKLDHVRFLAATMVFWWHYSAWGLVPKQLTAEYVPLFPPFSLFDEGHAGVSLFICITGFLFAYICSGKEIDYRQFLRNRFLRIFPLAAVAISVEYYFQSERTFDTQYILSTLLTTLMRVWDKPEIPVILWSVLLEFQFYLVFPFLFIAARVNGTKFLAQLLILFLLIRLAIYFINGSVQNVSYYTMVGRADQFAIAVFVGALYASKAGKLKKHALWIIVAGLIGSIGLSHLMNVRGGFYGWGSYPSGSAIWLVWTTLEAIVFTMFIAGYLALQTRMPSLVDRILAHGGKVSYSIYVWHLLIISFLLRIPDFAAFTASLSVAANFLLFCLFVVPISVLFATLSYNVIERPFLLLRKRYTFETNEHIPADSRAHQV